MLKLTGHMLDPGIAHPGSHVVFCKIEDVNYITGLLGGGNTFQLNLPLCWHSGHSVRLTAGRLRVRFLDRVISCTKDVRNGTRFH